MLADRTTCRCDVPELSFHSSVAGEEGQGFEHYPFSGSDGGAPALTAVATNMQPGAWVTALLCAIAVYVVAVGVVRKQAGVP